MFKVAKAYVWFWLCGTMLPLAVKSGYDEKYRVRGRSLATVADMVNIDNVKGFLP